MNIQAGDYASDLGDSIVSGVGWNEGNYSWPANPGGRNDQINATFQAPSGDVPARSRVAVGASRATIATATVGVVQPVPAAKKQVTFSSSGFPGADAATVAASVVPGVIASVPTGLTTPVFVVMCGINDAYEMTRHGRLLSVFTAGYDSILSQLRTAFPSARIVCMSCFCGDEAWQGSSGAPTWAGTFMEPAITNIDGSIQTLCGTYTATYVDIRAALLAWEVVNNPARDSGNHAGVPNGAEGAPVHPRLAGMMVMATAFFSAVTVVP